MHTYSLFQWILIFYIYGFLGWVFESCYVSIRNKVWVNRGFLKGPLLPIYACGAMVMLIVSIPIREDFVATFFAGMVAATALEYVVGVSMEALFKVKYWDYSDQKFHFQGRICLSSSIAWGCLTVLMTRVLHKPIDFIVINVSDWFLYTIVGVVSVIFVADTVVSVKAALDLRFMLEKLTKIRQDMDELQAQFALAKANTKDYIDELSERSKVRIAGIHEDVKDRWEVIQEKFAYSEEFVSEMREKHPELYHIYSKVREKRHEYSSLLVRTGSGLRKQILKNNPSATSKAFRNALADTMSHIRKRKKKNNKSK